ncbi:unnamed protein product [Debaryomyces fabryi]|nr:unnamed protein product [Debaryomyces fabryi]
MSCENSYISTIYPSFHTFRAIEFVEPEKELSINLAKIDFAIYELPYPLNEIPLDCLIELLTNLQRIVLLNPDLTSLFTTFFRTRLDKIINDVIIESIFNSGYKGIYFLPNNDCLTKVETLLRLVYDLNNPLNSTSPCISFVSEGITIQLLRCLKSTQISLLEHISDKPRSDSISDSILNSKLTTTYKKQLKVFQRTNEQYEYIYLKIVLINRLLNMVEEICNPSFEVFDYFYELLQHDIITDTNAFCTELMLVMAHFRQIVDGVQIKNAIFYEEFMNIRHCLKLIITTIHGKQNLSLESDKEFSKLLVLYIQIFQKNKVATIAKETRTSYNSSKKTVLKSSQKNCNVDNANYKYHLAKGPKEPEWVKNFYDIKANNETQLQITKEIVYKEVSSEYNTNNDQKNMVKQGFRSKMRNIWATSLLRYRKAGLNECKKCKFLPLHYLYHKYENETYIE